MNRIPLSLGAVLVSEVTKLETGSSCLLLTKAKIAELIHCYFGTHGQIRTDNTGIFCGSPHETAEKVPCLYRLGYAGIKRQHFCCTHFYNCWRARRESNSPHLP
jgi:hypothetical protein